MIQCDEYNENWNDETYHLEYVEYAECEFWWVNDFNHLTNERGDYYDKYGWFVCSREEEFYV